MTFKKRFILISFSILFFIQPAIAAEYRQIAGLIDTRTTFSDGAHDVDTLARLAGKRGFEVLFFNDHDRLVMEYGLLPLRNILRKRKELNSINKGGAQYYLDAVNKARENYPDMILIPGSETVPFYYWSGSFFKKNLTAHDHEKRILIIGMENPQDYKNLPIIHNGFSTRYVKHFLPLFLAFFIAFVLGLLLLREKGYFKISGMVVSAISLVLMISAHPFKSSVFNPYHGDQGIAPYQELINYVDSKGGFTFWNYPETASGVRKLGPIFVNTPPYPEALEQSQDYTGFAALYGDNITITEPGKQWDRVLLDFCNGKRKQPVWAIATADFHEDGQDGQKLGDFPTVFLVREKTKKDILTALQKGRMYACQAKYPQQIMLEEFSVYASGSKRKATLGEEIVLKGNPKIRISLALKKPVKNRVKVRLIRAGKLIKTFNGPLPMKIDFEDNYFKPGQKIYYRIDANGPGILVSNPIFVIFERNQPRG